MHRAQGSKQQEPLEGLPAPQHPGAGHGVHPSPCSLCLGSQQAQTCLERSQPRCRRGLSNTKVTLPCRLHHPGRGTQQSWDPSPWAHQPQSPSTTHVSPCEHPQERGPGTCPQSEVTPLPPGLAGYGAALMSHCTLPTPSSSMCPS